MKTPERRPDLIPVFLAAIFITLAASDFHPLWPTHNDAPRPESSHHFVTVAEAWNLHLNHSSSQAPHLQLAGRVKEADSPSRTTLFLHRYLFPPTHRIRTPDAGSHEAHKRETAG